MQKLDAEYQQKANTIKQSYVDSLKTALKTLAKKDDGDPDEIAKLSVKIKEVQKTVVQSPLAETTELEKALRGTTWEFANELITFQNNGTIGNKGWTARGLVTGWRVIDRRTVIFSIERGRDHDRYAVLTFSPNIDSYSCFNFEGKPFIGSRPR